MRIATYNVEWFDALFDDKGRLLDDGAWSGRREVTRAEQIAALAHVFRRIDADAIMVIEAPDHNKRRSTVSALQTFAAACDLRTTHARIGFPNATQQEIALLFDPEVIAAVHAPVDTPDAPRFDRVFDIDLDIDETRDAVVFSKPPFEVALRYRDRVDVRLIGAHLKSKAPHGARNRDEMMRLSISARRKQLAQAIWLHRRVVGHQAADQPVIVLGDLNDGPGLDEFEALFGRSSLEIVMGKGRDALFDPHAVQALSQKIAAQPATARFYIAPEKRYLQALLDYILVSPDLRDKAQGWRIWHPFDDPECWNDEMMRESLLLASDHFPVTLDLDL
ncbi:endonuclease/exonuclease/phosphatase family protein [Roseivivax sp. CAU 1753]